jgi:hypothetical protein
MGEWLNVRVILLNVAAMLALSGNNTLHKPKKISPWVGTGNWESFFEFSQGSTTFRIMALSTTTLSRTTLTI